MNKRKKIAYWEKGEHIISQKITKLPHNKYKHVEVVSYPKMRKYHKKFC